MQLISTLEVKYNNRLSSTTTRRPLRFEQLEDRQMLSVNLSLTGTQAVLAGTNINVSNNTYRDQAEMSVAVNPTNPLNIAGFSHSFIPEANGLPSDRTQIDLMYSIDGGTTWSTTTIDDGTHGIDDTFGFAVSRFDPTIQFDALGRLFVGYGHDSGSGTKRLVVARSDDGGESFALFTSVDSVSGGFGGANLDKWHVTTGLDPSTGDPAVYIAYLRDMVSFEREVRVAGSNDGGQSFVTSGALNDPLISSAFFTQFPHPAVGSNGELYVSWQDVEFGKLSLDVDLDGLFATNHAFGTDRFVRDLDTSLFFQSIPAQPNRGVFNGPVIDVDRSDLHSGRLYIVWTDAVSLPNTDVYVMFSDNQGATWSTPTAVFDSSASEFLPWIDVDQTTGSVNVICYQSAELVGGTNDEVNVVMKSSLDGGATFGAVTTLSTARSNADARENIDFKRDFLEYIGLAVHDGTIHGLWTDNRDNPADDFEAYTASAAFSSSTGSNLLTVNGDDPGSDYSDYIVVQLSSQNQSYVEVIVNDELNFAGLLATIDSIVIDAGLGADRILVDPAIWEAVDVDIVDPPQVMNVTISSTSSGGHSHSFADVIGANPNSGVQLAAMPVYQASRITVQFSEPIDVDLDFASQFHLTALSTIAAAPTFTGFNYDPATFAATWEFDLGDLPSAVQFLLTLDDSITDLIGTALDGNWVNPGSINTTNVLQSEFPSGDGQAGGAFKFLFTTVMPNAGVANLVNNEELTAILDNWGDFVEQFTQGDFDGDGYVANNDLTMLLDTWGIDLRNLLFLRDVNDDWKIDQDDINNIADVNGDGLTNQLDIDIVFEQIGLDLSDALVA